MTVLQGRGKVNECQLFFIGDTLFSPHLHPPHFFNSFPVIQFCIVKMHTLCPPLLPSILPQCSFCILCFLFLPHPFLFSPSLVSVSSLPFSLSSIPLHPSTLSPPHTSLVPFCYNVILLTQCKIFVSY